MNRIERCRALWSCDRNKAPVIQGAHGQLRKVRWTQPGRGKRGALRVFYYWDRAAERLYMIYVIEKSRQADLTQAQARELGELSERS